MWEQLEGIGIGFMERDYDKIVSNPQAIPYVVNFMLRTGLLQQYQHVGIDDDEPLLFSVALLYYTKTR